LDLSSAGHRHYAEDEGTERPWYSSHHNFRHTGGGFADYFFGERSDIRLNSSRRPPHPVPLPKGRGDACSTAARGLPLPSASACGMRILERQARQGELAGRGLG
ncbi:MAG: hypothetical protein ACLPX9_17860, partial [Rhodomicrobium sp.]